MEPRRRRCDDALMDERLERGSRTYEVLNNIVQAEIKPDRVIYETGLTSDSTGSGE